ncbi:MAG: hypothetical protein K5665_00140 [Saccharofermentans sp.]|nr:hypothetical protein [Saccharofermentans sp.]
MNTRNHKIADYILPLVFAVVWSILVYYAFVAPEIEWNKRNPNVQVRLSEHLIGVNGISDTNNCDLTWKIVNDVRIVGRRNGNVELSNDYQAFVVLNKTELRDTFVEGTYLLSETEIDKLFIDICDGREPEFEILETPQPVFGIIPNESSIVVSGRYEGTIVLTTNRVLPESETNIAQIWKESEHLPVLNIIKCFVSALIIFFVSHVVLRKTKNHRVVITVLCGSMICLGLITVYLASRIK